MYTVTHKDWSGPMRTSEGVVCLFGSTDEAVLAINNWYPDTVRLRGWQEAGFTIQETDNVPLE